MALASACPALHSLLPTEKRKLYTKHETVEPERGEKYLIFLRETADALRPYHKRSDTRTPSDGHWHELKWQQDRSRIDLKGKKCVKNLESTRNITSKILI